jgi:hypothetical protein
MLEQLARNFRTALRFPRWRWALGVAVVSDAVGFGLVLAPPVYWLVDAATAALLFVVLGWRWGLLTALAVEAVPGLQVFPAWTLVVLALSATGTRADSHGIGAKDRNTSSTQ